jgi:hypothetical protein
MTMLIMLDVLIFNPDQYLPPIIAALTVLGLMLEPLRRLQNSVMP